MVKTLFEKYILGEIYAYVSITCFIR